MNEPGIRIWWGRAYDVRPGFDRDGFPRWCSGTLHDARGLNRKHFSLVHTCEICGTDHRYGSCNHCCGTFLGWSDDDGSCLGCG